MQRALVFALVLLAACGRRPREEAPREDAGAPVASATTTAAPPPSATATTAAMGAGPCVAGAVAFHVSPRAPVAGAPLRVMAIGARGDLGALTIGRAGGPPIARVKAPLGGPPYAWTAALPRADAGAYRVEVGGACAVIQVAAAPAAKTSAARAPRPNVWPAEVAWSRAYEDFYASWIEAMFDAPEGQTLAWPALHEVLRDPKRNFLHDYLGEGEDDAAAPKPVVIQPDCADLPYFLRAYFAYKMGLPFGYSSCTRGGGGTAPYCKKWHSNLERPWSKQRQPMDAFGEFLRVTLADTVHSGTGRTAAADDATDYYPIAPTLENLRPGTIFADPYGHVLIAVKRVAGANGKRGVLLAVDGQPDGTVSRRRFWRGNFLFSDDPGNGSPGWKRFRPVVVEGGRPRTLSNAEIKANADYGDYALDQYDGGVEGFYDRMDDVLSPTPLDPTVALLDTIATFEEQVLGRVLSVANGQKNLAKGGDVIDMPEGTAIFETTGPWEDFSTPSRDLRLLIAIDVVMGFPARVARRPKRYAMPAGATADEVKAALEKRLGEELAKRSFAYQRTDGSSFELTLADVVARQKALEVAYNPNDCVEARWGAAPKSEEMKTCRRRAPGKQLREMWRHRKWFKERKRPARGS